MDKSGISEQVISLPKGGGALQGIGETFSPDLFTGTGNFTVPIALPAGRNGFQPELNLVYSTGNACCWTWFRASSFVIIHCSFFDFGGAETLTYFGDRFPSLIYE